MALNSLGNPGIAYHKGSISPAGFYYYDGTQWLGTGTLVNPSGAVYSSITDIDIVFDSLDRPVVAYSESRGALGGFIYVRRWNASTGLWGTLASINLGNVHPYRVELELVNNRPIVAYQTATNGSNFVVQVKGWNGSSWIDYGSPDSGYTFSLTLDKTKKPVLAYQSVAGLLVKRWDGTQWLPLGSALDVANTATNPIAATDANNNPVVAWLEPNTEYGYYIYVKRWNGSNWQQLGTFLSDIARPYHLDLTLDGEGNPFVIWQSNLDKAIYVKHWKALENKWRFVGPNPISNLQGSKTGHFPSIDWRNNSLVATWRRPSLYINGFYYDGKIVTKRYIP